MINKQPGDIVKIAGIEFVVLDANDSKLFVLAKNTVGECEFGPSNNYTDSFLREAVDEWLEGLTTSSLDARLISPRTIDLATLDGHKYGELEVMAAPLTMDEARKYAEFIPKADKWSWLATGWDAPTRGATLALLVITDGSWGAYYCSHERGIRPALSISVEALDTNDTNSDGSVAEDIFMDFVDSNVDGCGTDIHTMVHISGTKPFTNESVERVKKAIADYKTDNPGEWGTDGCLEAAQAQIEAEGFGITFCSPNMTIEF